MPHKPATTRTLLDNRHPEYHQLAPEWLFWQQSYEGGNAYRNAGHLFRFPKETRANYTERLKRASRLNFTKQVLDLLLQYLGKETPERKKDQASSAILEFWQDVDRHGTLIDDFMKSVGLMTALFGRYYIIVDKPLSLAKNKLEQNQYKLKPYAYMVSPLDVLDIERCNTSGKITQALIREYTRGAVNLQEARESDNLQERYRLWFKTEAGISWSLFQKNEDGLPEEIDAGIANISQVPIVEVRRTGGSLAEDIATLDRKIFNYESLLDQVLYEQTFSTLRLPWSGQIEKFYEQWELTLGTKSILPYDPSSGAAPDFIAPDARQGELILKAIDQSIARIYQAKNLLDTMGAIGITSNTQGSMNPASGIARGYDFEKLNAGLALFADDLEKAEKAIAALINQWEGLEEPVPNDLIDYPETFDVKTLLHTLEEARLLAQSVKSSTFQRKLQKKLVNKAAPKLSPEEYQVIMAEIDTQQSIDEG